MYPFYGHGPPRDNRSSFRLSASRSLPGELVVQGAHHRHVDDLGRFGLFHWTRNGTITFQRQISSDLMIVFQVLCQHCLQVFVEDDEMFQHSRRMDPINRSTWGSCHGERGAISFPFSQTRNLRDELGALNPIAIPQEVLRRGLEGERLHHLLCGPAG